MAGDTLPVSLDLPAFLERYRSWGLSVIPIAWRSKKPLVEWKPYQTRKAGDAEIQLWFGNGKSVNIGIVCGSISGNLVVLDFDDERKFWEFADRWKGKRGIDIHDETPVVATGRGYHVYLRCSSPVLSRKLPDCEIKGQGAYVLCPPSVHPDGPIYHFVNPETDLLQVMSLAEVGLESEQKSIANAKDPSWVCRALQGVAHGERDSTCVKLAGHFKGKGLDLEETLVILKGWAARCAPPFPEQEAEKCVRSAFSYQESRQHQALTLVWAKDIAAGEAIEGLWGSFLFPNSVHLLSGESGVGKTTLLYNLAIKAAEGGTLAGIPFIRPLKTLYLDLESPASLRARKLHVISEGRPPEGLAFVTAVNLEQNIGDLIEMVNAHCFNLVIVDTINQAFVTEKEDDNAEANRQMVLVRRLAEQGRCAVILVHHIGKGEQSKKVYKARGASARAASADVVMNLQGKSEDTICLELVKNRWVGGAAKLFLRKAGEDAFEPVEVDSEETASRGVKAQTVIMRMLEHGQMLAGDLIQKAREDGFTESTTRRALSDLLQLGKAVKVERGVYRLP